MSGAGEEERERRKRTHATPARAAATARSTSDSTEGAGVEAALDGLLAARRAATLAGRPFTSPPIATGAGGASVGVVEPESRKGGGTRGHRFQLFMSLRIADHLGCSSRTARPDRDGR